MILSDASIIAALACIILSLIMIPIVRLIYKAALIHEMVNHLYADEIGFRSTITTFALLKLKLVNFLILVGTLGLGLPYIIQRNMRFFTQHTQVRGDLEATRIKQASNRQSTDAEGLQEVMGLESGLI